MRKQEREIKSRDEIIDIIRRCDVCHLGLNDDGYPYILPLNFGFSDDGENLILYFHSALEGKKVDLIKRDNRASFEMDTAHNLEYFEDIGYCTMSYESVMGRGEIKILDEDEKMHALKQLMRQYHGGKDVYFNPAAISRTLVYALYVSEMTAKRKPSKMKGPKNEEK